MTVKYNKSSKHYSTDTVFRCCFQLKQEWVTKYYCFRNCYLYSTGYSLQCNFI